LQEISNNHVALSNYWSDLNKKVLNVISKKVVAYKDEIELTLELEGYRNRDVGECIKFLSGTAPTVHLNTELVDINGSPYNFYYFKKSKREKVEIILDQKIQILKKYNKKAKNFGVWVNKEFYPRVLENLNFEIIEICTIKYKSVKLSGDLDIISKTYKPSSSELFIDVKNRLSTYRKKDLFDFFSKLRLFNQKIVPIIIARRIYDVPKAILLSYGGFYIEMKKILVPLKYKSLSKEYNENIVNITRVVPNNLIPQDLTQMLETIKKFYNGYNFYRHKGKFWVEP